MMIHEKLMAGQFLLDFKNDRPGLMPAKPVTHQPKSLQHFPPLSPPMTTFEFYSAYAYQQQIQQQILNSHMTNNINMTNPVVQTQHSLTPIQQHSIETAREQKHSIESAGAEVLDLSRRDLVDSQRKTPSPSSQHTSSSVGSASPVGSPKSSQHQAQYQQPNNILPANLLFAGQVAHQQQTNNLATTIYPGIYYPPVPKQDSISRKSPPSATTVPLAPQTAPAINPNNVLQSFAVHSPQADSRTTTVTSPTSSTSNLSSLDVKNTRPFKAFPRDPLVIAANFAATDVLLDNRGERYTEYRKRVLEQIRSSNGGNRTVTNPKMRRTNPNSGCITEASPSNNSENDDDHHQEDYSDCDSNMDHETEAKTDSNLRHKTPTTTESNSRHEPQATLDSKAQENSLNNATSCSGSVLKDAAYYERRRKNNAAAKKSRDRRRIKEDEIAIRAAYLERQNIELLCQIDALKAQLAALTAKMT